MITRMKNNQHQASFRTQDNLLCKALSVPYGLIMKLRRWGYARGIFKSYRVDAPVICVGNITTGGTGKTPMVAWVVNQLAAMQKTPAIITRGYKAVDGKSDEAELLKKLTGANVVLNPNRVAGAQAAINSGANVIVMDDGFQHLRLQRDLNIVLVDATNPFGFDMLLPAGRLREPMDGLARAGAFVITRCDKVCDQKIAEISETLKKYSDSPIAKATHAPVKLRALDGTEKELGKLGGAKVFCFSGIGNPAGFVSTAEKLGAKIVGQKHFADHVDYDKNKLAEICRLAKNADAEFLLTTEKDGVKISPQNSSLDIYQLAIEMKIVSGEADLLQKIKQTAFSN